MSLNRSLATDISIDKIIAALCEIFCCIAPCHNNASTIEPFPVLKIRTIFHAWDLWKLAGSCKQLHLLCPPDLWNLPGFFTNLIRVKKRGPRYFLSHLSAKYSDSIWHAYRWWPVLYWQPISNITQCGPHYGDVIMNAMAYQIISISIVCSTICSGADQRKHQSSASLAFVRGIHWSPVDSPHKGPVTRKCFHLMTSSWATNLLWHYILKFGLRSRHRSTISVCCVDSAILSLPWLI